MRASVLQIDCCVLITLSPCGIRRYSTQRTQGMAQNGFLGTLIGFVNGPLPFGHGQSFQPVGSGRVISAPSRAGQGAVKRLHLCFVVVRR